MSDAEDRTETLPVVDAPTFEAPLPAADVRRCPACLSPVRSDQRYCLECGERLLPDEIPPPPGGGSALSDRSTTILIVAAVVLIVLGAALAWVALRGPSGEDGQPTTDTAPPTTATATDATDTGFTDTGMTDTGFTDTTITDTGVTPTETTSANGWPVGQSGWAVILASKSQSQFQEADAQVIADEASAAGVPEVGVLDSSQFPSLNPGYWAVFSGPYATKAEADAAAATIRGQGYAEAYSRKVEP